jgi:hypothetical protein
MSGPVVPSWHLNDPITSEKLQQMCDAISYLLIRPNATLGQQTSAQNITNDVDTAIQWNLNVVTYKIAHSSTVNNTQVTPQEPGYYLVTCSVELAGDATGYRKLWAQQNGSNLGVDGSSKHSKTGTDTHTIQWVGVMFFNGTTDYMEMLYRQNSGSTHNLGFGEFNPRLNIVQLTLPSF